jgi:hypothetical protein
VTVCPAWVRPRAMFWPRTRIRPVAGARRCTRMGSDGGRGGGPAGRAPRSRVIWAGVQRVGPGAQQHPWAGVGEHQRVRLDSDAGELAAGDLCGGQAVRAEADQAAAGDRPAGLDGRAVPGGWQRGGSGGDGAGGDELGQVVDRQAGAEGLDPGACRG